MGNYPPFVRKGLNMAKDRLVDVGAFTDQNKTIADRNFGDISLITAQVDVNASTTL